MPEIMSLSITPSLMIEFLFCPRFIYFMEVMNIRQEEQERYKVQKGREVHKFKSLTNIDYSRKKINVKEKLINQEFYSEKLQIHGKIDEVLILEDGTIAILDYKYAEYKDKIFNTYKTQLLMYSLLAEEKLKKPSNKGFLVYTRSKNHIEEIVFQKKDREELEKNLETLKKIILKNYYPKGTPSKLKCDDCCYSNICIK